MGQRADPSGCFGNLSNLPRPTEIPSVDEDIAVRHGELAVKQVRVCDRDDAHRLQRTLVACSSQRIRSPALTGCYENPMKPVEERIRAIVPGADRRGARRRAGVPADPRSRRALQLA